MPVICTVDNRALTMELVGEIDHHRAREWMNQIDQALNRSHPLTLRVNFKGVTFMDSSGIALLLRAFRWMERTGGTMTLEELPPQVERVLKTARLDRIIPVVSG